MIALLSNLSQIAKDFYTDYIGESLNQESNFVDLFNDVGMPWEGRQIVLPVHVGRSTAVAYIGEGGALPAADHQKYVDLVITTSELAARVSISTRALTGAKKKGKGAFVGFIDQEMTRIKDDVNETVDKKRVYGGMTKGLLNEHISNALWPDAAGPATIAVPAAGSYLAEYAGDYDPFRAVVTANSATWVRVRLFRQDTLAEILPTLGIGATAPGTAIFVSNFNETAMTLTLSVISDGAADVATDVTAAGFAISLGLHTTVHTLVGGGDAGLTFGRVVDFSLEPHGILDNLCNPTHWTVDRTTATGGDAVALQSNVLTNAIAGLHARGALTPARLQAIDDIVMDRSGKEYDLVYLNARARSIYVAAATATLLYNTNQDSKVDLKPKKLSLGGDQMRTARHFPRGAMAFLRKENWKLAKYDEPGWMDEDGSIFSRVPGVAAYEAAYEVFDNLLCDKPNAQALFCGFNV
jgi:hypothetical protein